MTAYLVKNVLPFEGQTQAKRLASDIFNNLFITCIEKTFDEIDAKFETYAAWIRPKESFVCCHYSNTISKHLASGSELRCGPKEIQQLTCAS